MDIARRVALALTVVAVLAACTGPPGDTPVVVTTGSPGAPAPSTAPVPTGVGEPTITADMVRTTESTILSAVDAGIQQDFQACKSRTQQGGDVSTCDGARPAGLAARKALVGCFARAEQAPTPADAISAIMACQVQVPH